MKKAKKTAKRSSAKKTRTRKVGSKKSTGRNARTNARKARRTVVASRKKVPGVSRVQASVQAGSAASMAAGVLKRRAAKVESQARASAQVARPPVKRIPPASGSSGTRTSRGSHSKAPRPHGAAALPGNRPLVRVSRPPQQFNYMKAPGAAGGFDVGDTVEVFCDHEQDSERVRGWIKGVVVQVDNKLVAVQFRSNVFLTDGWMVPDRILWYSLTSDQIRGIGVGKKIVRAAIPEY